MFGFGKKPEGTDTLNQPIPSGWKIADRGLLGSGGMSRVFRVLDETLNREVAFKVMRPERTKEAGAFERFIEEAKITAQLDHPNIPPVYALWAEQKKSTCFTMKVLEGMTFQEMIQTPPRGPEKLLAALEVLVRVCDAVAFAHSRGIVHCDLKPHNVIVAEHGQIYVVDWGLARRMKEPPPEVDQGNAIGTPAYMAPEQAHGENDSLDERTDVFALGGMLYRTLTGRPPYVAETAEETLKLAAECQPPPPERAAPKGHPVPRRLAAIAMRALSANPDDRYQTAGAFRKELEEFVHGTARLPEKKYPAGKAIVTEGEVGDCAYVIIEGHCQASREIAGSTEVLRLLGEGEMFGETAVLTGSPRLATVTALVDTTVAVVDRAYLEEEMERTSLIALAIRTVASTFVEVNAQTAALLHEQRAVETVELALREIALEGQPGPGRSRWVPWKPLLARLVEQSGLTPEAVTERIGRQVGFRIETGTDRLMLSPPERR